MSAQKPEPEILAPDDGYWTHLATEFVECLILIARLDRGEGPADEAARKRLRDDAKKHAIACLLKVSGPFLPDPQPDLFEQPKSE